MSRTEERIIVGDIYERVYSDEKLVIKIRATVHSARAYIARGSLPV